MDVATDVANEPKFRRVQRHNPVHVAPAFMAYMAVVGESWKAGRRVAIADAWPALLPFDVEVVGSLVEAGLLDSKGMVPAKAWNGWYRQAHERREKARERWRRANDKRGGESTNNSGQAASAPRGSRDDAPVVPPPSVPLRTAPSAPSVPSEVAPAENDPYDEAEIEALQWLARHHCNIRVGDGYHREIVTMVERHGVNAVVGKFDRLSGAGVMDGDTKGFVFGAKDALFRKPDLKALEREERAGDNQAAFNRGVENTQRLLRQMRGEA